MRRYFLLFLLCTFTACSSPDPEQALKQQLDRLQQAVENKQRDEIRALMATDFIASNNEGTVNLQALMLYYFRQNPTILVFRQQETITLHQQTADVVSDVLVTGSANWLPERGRRLQVSMRWKMLNDEWKLAKMKWQSLQDEN